MYRGADGGDALSRSRIRADPQRSWRHRRNNPGADLRPPTLAARKSEKDHAGRVRHEFSPDNQNPDDWSGRLALLATRYRTQKAFGDAVGLKNPSYYLKGRYVPGGEILARIIRATGCDAHWLMTGEGHPFPPPPPPDDAGLVEAADLLVRRARAGLDEMAAMIRAILPLLTADQRDTLLAVVETFPSRVAHRIVPDGAQGPAAPAQPQPAPAVKPAAVAARIRQLVDALPETPSTHRSRRLQVLDALGLHRRHYARWLGNGKPPSTLPPDLVERAATLFGAPADWIGHGTGDPPTPNPAGELADLLDGWHADDAGG